MYILMTKTFLHLSTMSGHPSYILMNRAPGCGELTAATFTGLACATLPRDVYHLHIKSNIELGKFILANFCETTLSMIMRKRRIADNHFSSITGDYDDNTPPIRSI